MMAVPSRSNFFHKNISKHAVFSVDRSKNQFSEAMCVKSYGTITFPDNRSHQADFIRISNKASVMHVKEFLTGEWSGERPSLVISITGGAKKYNMKPRLLRAFQRGLLKVARTTGAWIITGGMNRGIMKLVGEIVETNPDRSRPIQLIGIATWGCVSGFEELDVQGSIVHYAKPSSETKGQAPLEPNHTKFIFVDDESKGQYGGEIAFRAKLEKAISGGFFASKTTTNSSNLNASLSRTSSLQSEQSDSVPVVLLVVEGGPNTVRTVHEAVVQNNIPAVFLEGTGRCCDLFSKAFQLYEENRQKFEHIDKTRKHVDRNIISKRNEELKNTLREQLKDELRGISGETDASTSNTDKISHKTTTTTAADKTDYFELVYECIDTRKTYLNIISLNSRDPVEPDIDLVILQALLNAASISDNGKVNFQQKREQLRLALEWNRVDIARNYIMKDVRDWDNIGLKNLFVLALERNQIEFIKLFLEHDFSLTNLFGNSYELANLYMFPKKESHDVRKHARNSLLSIYTRIIQPLIGDSFNVAAALSMKEWTTNSESIQKNDNATCTCCRPKQQQHTPSISDHNDSEQFESAALIATLLYKKHAHKEHDNSYKKLAVDFENLAVQILDKFYQVNSQACTKAIIRRIPIWGNATWLDLAVAADAKEFIARRAVQDLLNNIWFGYIDQRTSHMKIIFSTLMIWYSGFLHYNYELVQEIDQTTFLDEENKKLNLTEYQTSEKKWIVYRKRPGLKLYFINITRFLHTPYVKYLYNLYFHMIFLLIFSYVILCDFFPLYGFLIDICVSANDSQDHKENFAGKNDNQPSINNSLIRNGYNASTSGSYGFQQHKRPSGTEFVLLIWIFTLVCEEIRQLFSTEAQSKQNAIIAYFKIFWNKLDALAIVLFFIGFTLRFIPITECYCAARIVLSVDLTLWFMRTLDMFAAVKRLGPKLIMIGEMVNDLRFFMTMFIVFVLAFGVSSYSLIHGIQKFSWHLPRNIINHAYWQIFGDLNTLETFSNNYQANGYVAFILLVAYMAVVSILLVNLLIAMFSNTFNNLQTDTDRIWKFQHYALVCEYLSRPSLPPPLIIFCHLWRLTLYIAAKYFKLKFFQDQYDKHLKRTNYKILLHEKISIGIESAEDAFGDEVYYNFLKMNRKSADETGLDEERV
ncbi:unnamed protein product [Rotaria sp. Silwood1]|nr:unnamed protein product [Rotaria sp. Silwood1]